jgi:hypothetical protein
LILHLVAGWIAALRLSPGLLWTTVALAILLMALGRLSAAYAGRSAHRA